KSVARLQLCGFSRPDNTTTAWCCVLPGWPISRGSAVTSTTITPSLFCGIFQGSWWLCPVIRLMPRVYSGPVLILLARTDESVYFWNRLRYTTLAICNTRATGNGWPITCHRRRQRELSLLARLLCMAKVATSCY